MKIPRIFTAKLEKEFAINLAHELKKALPPESVANNKKGISVNRVTVSLERIYASASEFNKKNRVGFVKRAILANSFKWEMKEIGYTIEFIAVATEGLIVTLSQKNVS